MCVLSMVADFYDDKFKPYVENPLAIPMVSREEFEALRKEVLDMKELLKKAKAYDEKNNEPNCEKEEKLKTLRKIAEAVGIDLDDVLKPV